MSGRAHAPRLRRAGPWRLAALAAAAAALMGPLGTRTAAAQVSPQALPGLAPAAAASGAAVSAKASAAASAAAAPPLKLQLRLAPVSDAAAASAPAYIQADTLTGRSGVSTVARGAVEFRRAGVVLRADELNFRHGDGQAVAKGQVSISRGPAVYTGRELHLNVEQFTGHFLEPSFDFAQLGAGGRAARIDFLGGQRARATQAIYTSCPRDGATEPAWLLSTKRVDLDFDKNEGVAEGAVLRFLGVPLLAAPTLSFPLNDARKSGWLPPNLNIDNRSGVEFSVPYYLNLAPNRDATLTPRIATRRGPALDAEYRYLTPLFEGALGLDALPQDRVVGRSRYALRWAHSGTLGLQGPGDGAGGNANANAGAAPRFWRDAHYSLQGLRVSDDDWWKDFPRSTPSLTPRLLSQRADFEAPLPLPGGTASLYARLAHWQVLQASEAIQAPYQRSPQLGLRAQWSGWGGLEAQAHTELNRFTLSDGASLTRPEGSRWHAQATLTRPLREAGWWVVPGLTLHSAVYDTDGRPRASRHLASWAIDSGATFERETRAFGRDLQQTLEPRLRYARTPYRDQSALPNFDAAAQDFNFTSIYADNAWSGVDRISDTHQLTFGATTRLMDAQSGAELLRLGVVQRMLFRDQRVTPDELDPAADGPALTRRFSDLLLLGSTAVVPNWVFDGALRYNADSQRPVRSILSARYTPGDYRTLSATYRFTRGQSELVDLGWQWPLARLGEPGAACNGRLYSVGRLNYSLRDSRITDSLLGLEFDAGCWIGRVVAERVSTGRTEATTRLMLQLELVGLSRLGSNPLRVLKDNIPGYQLLREDRNSPSGQTIYD